MASFMHELSTMKAEHGHNFHRNYGKFFAMIAGAAMALSSVSVVTNSLRLGKFRL